MGGKKQLPACEWLVCSYSYLFYISSYVSRYNNILKPSRLNMIGANKGCKLHAWSLGGCKILFVLKFVYMMHEH